MQRVCALYMPQLHQTMVAASTAPGSEVSLRTHTPKRAHTHALPPPTLPILLLHSLSRPGLLYIDY